MHSSLVRVQNAFGLFTSLATVLAVMVLLSSYISPQNPSGTVELDSVQVLSRRIHARYATKEEVAVVQFDLDMDLSSLFNWNTKQVFVYIKAIYPSQNPKIKTPNEAIIWDAIIPASIGPRHQNQWSPPKPKSKSKSRSSSSSSSSSSRSRSQSPVQSQNSTLPGVVSLRKQASKYRITDPTGKIANRKDVRLELGWNIQPWVGALEWRREADFGNWASLKGGVSESFDMPKLNTSPGGKSPGLASGREKNRGRPS